MKTNKKSEKEYLDKESNKRIEELGPKHHQRGNIMERRKSRNSKLTQVMTQKVKGSSFEKANW